MLTFTPKCWRKCWSSYLKKKYLKLTPLIERHHYVNALSEEQTKQNKAKQFTKTSLLNIFKDNKMERKKL